MYWKSLIHISVVPLQLVSHCWHYWSMRGYDEVTPAHNWVGIKYHIEKGQCSEPVAHSSSLTLSGLLPGKVIKEIFRTLVCTLRSRNSWLLIGLIFFKNSKIEVIIQKLMEHTFCHAWQVILKKLWNFRMLRYADSGTHLRINSKVKDVLSGVWHHHETSV